jgi:hypothetical protein
VPSLHFTDASCALLSKGNASTPAITVLHSNDQTFRLFIWILRGRLNGSAIQETLCECPEFRPQVCLGQSPVWAQMVDNLRQQG